MRIALSAGLAVPLLFFVFLAAWFDEGWGLVAVGAGVYLYVLAQFFVFQNPNRHVRRDAGDPASLEPGEKL